MYRTLFLGKELFGFAVRRLSDVGVAGIHRLLAKAHMLQEASAIIVVAGMDCALPSVVVSTQVQRELRQMLAADVVSLV